MDTILVQLDSSNNSENSDGKKQIGKVKKIILLVFGTISLILGVVGIVIPILPTTPFLLLTAACYARGSPRFYNWLLNNRLFGFYIRNYREGKGMPLNYKVFTISLLWITILISIIFFIAIVWVEILLVIIAITVSIHIILIRPKKVSKESDDLKK